MTPVNGELWQTKATSTQPRWDGLHLVCTVTRVTNDEVQYLMHHNGKEFVIARRDFLTRFMPKPQEIFSAGADAHSVSYRQGYEAGVKAATADNRANDLLHTAWGIIANVHGGDWDKAPANWRDAAVRWRNDYNKHLSAEIRARA